MGTAHRQAFFAVAFGVLLTRCPTALPLDPSLDVNQYAHTAWTIRGGFCKGTITSIAQTPDGYLWLGTEFGLLRFDGVRTSTWAPSTGNQLPDSYIRSLLAARDGTLWIGTAEGLASWKKGALSVYPELAGRSVDALIEDHEGTLWAGGQGTPTARLCAIHGATVHCYGQDGGLGQYVTTLHEDRGGSLWVGGLAGVWRWNPGPPRSYGMPSPVSGVQNLIDDDNGALLIAVGAGITRFVNGESEAYSLPGAARQFRPRELLRDRNGGLWVGTADQGLLHVHEGRTDSYARTDGLSGDFVERLFEDREGNIWVATLDGLDRFRDFAIPTISVDQGLSNDTVESVLAARDGSVWLATADGLDRWSNGEITIYRKPGATALKRGSRLQAGPREIISSGLPDDAVESLFQDREGQIWVSTRSGVARLRNGQLIPVSGVPGGVHSMAQDRAGDLWISQAGSLFRLHDGRAVEQIPWERLGHPDGARVLAADPLQGGLWFGFRDGGVAYFEGGQIRARYTAADGLGAGHIRDLQLDREGILWAATEGGLSRLKNGRIETLTSKNGLPCDAVHWIMQDDARSYWLYTPCGLVRISQPELDEWAAHPKQTVQVTLFDSSDGVRTHATTTGYSPSVAKSNDGRLWFLPWDGVSVIDPGHLHFNSIPPPVRIEEVVADHKVFNLTPDLSLRLPPLVRDVEIDYTALSFVAPEKVLFRYKLEGRDRDWQDAGYRRQAFYTNLSPRGYQFLVTASNNSGVWSKAGAALSFSITPAYYQTFWFHLTCAAAFLGLIWAVYRLRLRSIKRRSEQLVLMNARLESQIIERKRAEEALALAQEELTRVNRVMLVGETAASIAHEVNQPIAATVTNASTGLRWLAAQPPDLDEAREALGRIVKDGKRAGEVIRRIRALVKKSPPRKDWVSINDTIQEAVVLMGIEAEKNAISIQSHLRSNLPLVLGDRTQLQQVILNLIKNAIEAIAESGNEPRELLVSSAIDESNGVVVAVRDTGVGFDPLSLGHLFDSFYTTKPDGMGMGLAICRSIVEVHGGRLWAAPNTPRGAVFQFTLPADGGEG